MCGRSQGEGWGLSRVGLQLYSRVIAIRPENFQVQTIAFSKTYLEKNKYFNVVVLFRSSRILPINLAGYRYQGGVEYAATVQKQK